MTTLRRPLRSAILGIAFVASGCLFDSDSGPASLLPLWPEADEMRWDYSLVRREWSSEYPLYPSREEVPPAPAIEEVAEGYETRAIGDRVYAENETSYRFEFDGHVTTKSGATGRHVVTTVLDGTPTAKGTDLSALFGRLARARPDLRARIAELGSESARSIGDASWQPNFLDGYAWEKSAEHIGGYGDVSTHLSWLYLESTREGDAFTLQLLPELVSDAFLHGLVLGRRTIQTPAGEF